MKTQFKVTADAVFRAFSDRTRLRILSLLQRREQCVCDLVEVLGVPQPKASRHLAYLRRVGLVAARKNGYWTYYRIATEKGGLQAKLMECLPYCGDVVVAPTKNRKPRRSSCSDDCCD